MPAKTKPLSLKGSNQDDELGDATAGVPLRMWGKKGDDKLVGGTASDDIRAGSGDDLIIPGLGGGRIDGGADFDTLLLQGSIFDYEWTSDRGKALKISHRSLEDETFLIRNVEKIVFDDFFFHPEVEDEVIVGATNATTDEDTMKFTLSAFDFDGDLIKFIGAELVHDDKIIALELLQETQNHITYGGSSAEFIVGFAPPQSDEFYNWQYLAADEDITQSIKATVSTTNPNGVENFFDVFIDISIAGINDAPLASDVTYTFEKEEWMYALTDAFTDVDISDSHTFSLTWTGGIEVNYTLDHGSGNIIFEDPGIEGTAYFDWTVTDESSSTSSATASFYFPKSGDTAGVLLDFEEFHPDAGGNGGFSVTAPLTNGFQFSGFATVIETDEHPNSAYIAGNSPNGGDNVVVNGFRQTFWVYRTGGTDIDDDGDIDEPTFDFESVFMTAIEDSGIDPSGMQVKISGFLDGSPGGTFNQVGHQIVTLSKTPTLIELDDLIFDNVDQVRFELYVEASEDTNWSGYRYAIDDMFLMPVEDVFIM